MATVDLWLTAGQSLMVGLGKGQDAPACDPDVCWEWPGGLPLVTVDDPESTDAAYKAQTGSMLPSFAKAITIATGRPSVIVRAAVGGTALLASNANANGDWSPTGTLFGNATARMLQAITDVQSLGHTIGHVHVLWSQGYSDAAKGNDIEDWGPAWANLVARFRTALSRPSLKVYSDLMYAPEAANETVAARCLDMREQQLELRPLTDGIELAFIEGEFYAERNWVNFDQLHYNQAGNNYMGQQYAAFIAADLGLVPATPEVDRSPTSALARLLLPADRVLGTPTYITPGEHSWKVPGGITSIGGEAIGAGGGGGGGDILNNAGGGGGGAYAGDPTIAVTPFETLTIVVGTAGTGGLNATNGVAGTPSGIKRGSTWLLKADAGLGGRGTTPFTGGSAGLAANSVGETVTSGTNGSTGGTGSNFGHGGAAASGGTLTGGAGGTGTSNTTSNPGNPGSAPGGGGAGKLGTSGRGGAGARGVVKLNLPA